MTESDLPSTMWACEYNAASPSGITFKRRPPPITSDPPRPGIFGTSLFASPGNLVVRVRACGVNPVDAKYIIGDKFPESWMDWCARRVSGLEIFHSNGDVTLPRVGRGCWKMGAQFTFLPLTWSFFDEFSKFFYY